MYFEISTRKFTIIKIQIYFGRYLIAYSENSLCRSQMDCQVNF